MSSLKQHGQLRWAPSYLRRQGQMTPGQKRAYRDHWEEFGLPFQHGQHLDLDAAFSGWPEDSPLWLEIGFGMGENLVFAAAANPDKRILGIEVHKPGIGAALKKVVASQVENVRLIRGDARLILSDFLAPNVCLNRVSVLFPDPWHNEDNHHRRIVADDLLELIELRMNYEGIFHVATDVSEYAEYVTEMMRSRDSWSRCSDPQAVDHRCMTQYEAKGIAAGNPIFDLFYRYKSV